MKVWVVTDFEEVLAVFGDAYTAADFVYGVVADEGITYEEEFDDGNLLVQCAGHELMRWGPFEVRSPRVRVPEDVFSE